MSGELRVDPEALALASRGIDDTIDDLNGMGVLSEGETGRGLGALALTGMQAGHQGLAGALDAFCDRWGWGVRGLVVDANRAAHSLGLSAGIYAHEDDAVKRGLTAAGKSFLADPRATSDEVRRASWDDLRRGLEPGRGGRSFDDALGDSSAAWRDAVGDLAATERERMTDPLGYLTAEAGRASRGVLGGGEG